MKIHNLIIRFSLIVVSILSFNANADLPTKDLLPGDLIFDMNSLGEAEHVSIFTGMRKGEPYVTHAVAKPHNAVITTALAASPGVEFIVFRNRNLSLAMSAQYRMALWAKLRVPYDQNAAELMDSCADDLEFCQPDGGIFRWYRYARDHWAPNFYRIIKFASRRNIPTLPKSDDIGSSGRGLRCDEAVILAYQVEELRDYIKDTGGFWLSDKYAAEFIIDTLKPSHEYLKYRQRLVRPDEYRVKQKNKRNTPHHVRYNPSIVAWDDKNYGKIEDFVKTFKTSLPIDAKVSSPAVLLYHVQEDFENWASLGELTIGPQLRSPEEKEIWKKKLAEDLEIAEIIKSDVVKRLRNRSATTSERAKPQLSQPVKLRRTKSFSDFIPQIKANNSGRLSPKEKNESEIINRYGTPVKNRLGAGQ